jgi:hypothetical protein
MKGKDSKERKQREVPNAHTNAARRRKSNEEELTDERVAGGTQTLKKREGWINDGGGRTGGNLKGRKGYIRARGNDSYDAMAKARTSGRTLRYWR